MPMPDIVNLESHYIGSPTPGVNLYQLPNAAMQVLEDIINATWNEGKTTKDEFSAKISAAVTGFLDVTTTPHVTAGTASAPAITEPTLTIPATLSVATPEVTEPTVSIPSTLSVSSPTVTEPTVTIPSSLSVATPTIAEPTVSIPSSLSASDLFTEWKTEYLDLAAWFVLKFTGFMETYFPDEQPVYEAAQNYLSAALANPEVGLPPSVASQIWGDDAARILSDKTRAQDTVIAQFAARRFPLPPDAAASAVLQIEQKAQDELAESSRKVAIMSVDLQKFNVEKILALHNDALKAAVEYIRALASGPELASRLVNVGYDIQTKLISAASSFYTARANAAEVVAKAASMDAEAKTKLISVGTQVTGARTAIAELAVRAESADAEAKTKLIGVGAQVTGARTALAELAVRAESADAEAKTKLLSAGSQLFGARIQASELGSKLSQFNTSTTLEAAVKNQMADLAMVENHLKALLEEAKEIAAISTALFNNLDVQASLRADGGTTVSQSNEF